VKPKDLGGELRRPLCSAKEEEQRKKEREEELGRRLGARRSGYRRACTATGGAGRWPESDGRVVLKLSARSGRRPIQFSKINEFNSIFLKFLYSSSSKS
jgi:hypothetical protein